jgi:hypothetical protein
MRCRSSLIVSSRIVSTRIVAVRIVAISLSVAIFLPAVNARAASEPSSAIDVVYIVNNGGLETYDVDAQTGIPADEGLFVVPPENPTVVPSSNDHFIYVIGNNPGSGALQMWVFATNSVGVPQYPPIQTINFESYTSGFSIDPDGTQAYAAQFSKNSQGQMLVGIRYFTINPLTGMVVKSPKVAATYPPNGPCGTASAGFAIIGFNPKGNELYDDWGCSYPDSLTVTYYTRQVDQQTGALGPDVQTFSWTNGADGFDQVTFTPTALIDFNVPNNFNYGINSLDVYPLSGGTTPIFSCTAEMLRACGYGLSENVDPSGNYILFRSDLEVTEVTKLELAKKQIVDTGNSFPDLLQVFSPDDKLIYAANDNSLGTIPIYVFDAATGAVSYNGGEITVEPPPIYNVVPAVLK